MKEQKKKEESQQEAKGIKTDKISRNEALSKAGKYVAFTAASMLFLLSPKKAQASSTPTNPGRGW